MSAADDGVAGRPVPVPVVAERPGQQSPAAPQARPEITLSPEDCMALYQAAGTVVRFEGETMTLRNPFDGFTLVVRVSA